jgi:signal transduction histidine kinase
MEVASLCQQALMELLVRAADPPERERLLKLMETPAAQPAASPRAQAGRLAAAHGALRRLNALREEEARRIAQALHDDAAQLIASAHFAVDEVGREADLPEAGLERIRRSLDQIEERLRSLSHELRPPMLDDLGLPAAVEFLAASVSRRSGVRIDVESRTEGRLPEGVEITLYRSIQEALTNAVRHGRPGRISVRLGRNSHAVTCAVRDDGQGFQIDETVSTAGTCGLGLLGIRERVEALSGSVRITSAPGRGTQVLIGIPLEAARTMTVDAPL